MSGTPPGSGACCPPRTEGITYLKLGPQSTTVGMVGLQTVFTQLWALGRRPADASDEELVGMARKSNWIPASVVVEAEYANALRDAYRVFYSRRQEGIDGSRA